MVDLPDRGGCRECQQMTTPLARTRKKMDIRVYSQFPDLNPFCFGRAMRPELEETLAHLHQQLESIDDLDEAEVQRLRVAAFEIQSTLDRSDVSSATLAGRLEEATRQFSQSHPVLTNTVGRIADLLSQMGI